MKGILFVLSGPSGTGKGTVVSELLKRDASLTLSVSMTTREVRAGEVPGVTYNYVTKDEFLSAAKGGGMLEYAEYSGNYYGTPRANVESILNEGRDVLLEIEPQGALKVKSMIPEAELIFLIPPSMKELKKRLEGRGREDSAEIAKRLAAAKWELAQAEKYNVHIVNDDLDTCVREIMEVMMQKRRERRRIEELIEEEV